ncbi:MAG: hypothetical protein HUU50_16975 [Candidatus Brocadiae bacterium]|nr:hypothetical protein [Candidatus Brocadiia bacterium]
MMNKRFLIIALSLLALWLVPYLFFLNPWNREIQKRQTKIRSLKDNILGLYQGENALQQESFSEKEEQSKMLRLRLQEISKKLQWQGVSPRSDSILEFRSRYDQSKAKLQQEANKMGISVDETLGIPRNLPSAINQKYWISLELGCYILSRLLQTGEKKEAILSIDKIHYPDLQEESRVENQFMVGYPVELSITCSYSFLLKAFHGFSQVASFPPDSIGFPFLTMEEMAVSATPKSDIVEAKLRLVAWRIFPEGTFVPDAEKKQSPVVPQNIPIWERY